ncbi:HTH_Tnp_Tc3_2 domain-containing protein [Trichonephila clavipes]|nr:HTH_Tnp_Tc3_2 domain-containing protein [Trichonephila clavipes]
MPGKRARRHFSQLSEFERGMIIGMKTAGWSMRRVAGQVDRSECAVRNCEQWTRGGTHAWKTGSGATRKTTRRDDRRIVRQALVDPTVTRSIIRADVGVAIVSQTIYRRLAEVNLKSKRSFRALLLTSEHRQLRLQWRKARSIWNVTNWQKVLLSDESRFVLGTDDAVSALFHTTGSTTTERPSIKTDSPLLYEMTSLLRTSASSPMSPHQSSCSNHTAKESTAPREPQRTLKTLYYFTQDSKRTHD